MNSVVRCGRGFFCFVVMSAALAACGGTMKPLPGTVPVVVASPTPVATSTAGGGTTGPTGTARVTISFTVSTSPQAHARKTQSYFPSGTQSVSLYVTAVNGVAPSSLIYTTVAVGSGASGCTGSGTAVTCVISIAAPVGSDTFSARAYAQANGAGQPLSIGTSTATIVAGQTADVPVTFLPVVSFFTYTITPSNSGPINTPGTFTLNVTAEDVLLHPIGGTDPYYSPIVVATQDTGGHVTASPALPATLTAPGQTVTFTYDGQGTAASYIFTIAVPGDLVSGTVRPTSVPIMFTSTGQHLYFTSQATSSIYVYDIAADGSLTGPSRTIAGATTTLSSPTRIFVDKLGAIYVVNLFDHAGALDSNVLVFAAGANGNVAPTTTLAAGQHPVYVGPNGDYDFVIVALGSANDPGQSAALFGSIYTSAVPNGARLGTGSSMKYPDMNSFTVSPAQGQSPPNLTCAGTLETYDQTGDGTVACFGNPISVDSNGYANQFFTDFSDGPTDVKFRPDGKIAVVNQGIYGGPGFNISTYAAPSIPATSGTALTATPTSMLTGGLQYPSSVAFDALGNMYVADPGFGSYQGAIKQYPMDATGGTGPTRTISGLSLVYGVAVGP